jgi:hypothetical protein
MDASLDAIKAVPGLGDRLAAAIYSALHAPAIDPSATRDPHPGDGGLEESPQ